MAFDLQNELSRRRDRVNRSLERILPGPEAASPELARAVRAAVLSGGKRLRPILCLEACRTAGGRAEAALPAALAVELIHSGSLVFDDLPCMDDARERRGQPTLHLQFREGVALQAGDALITLAFELLTGAPWPADAVLRGSSLLARVVGSRGMSGGQLLDLSGPGDASPQEQLQQVHRGKTGSLIQASLVLGALAAGAGDELTRRLESYGAHLGLAFQIVDDILDAEQSRGVLGKDAGRDAAMGRLTFYSLLGPREARRRAEQEVRAALASLRGAGRRARILRGVARFVLERRS